MKEELKHQKMTIQQFFEIVIIVIGTYLAWHFGYHSYVMALILLALLAINWKLEQLLS